MRRLVVLVALVAIGGLTAAVAAVQQPAADKPKVIEVEKLRDNLFVLRGQGGGGNTAVFVGSSGVVVVDTKNPGWGQPILDQIKQLTEKPVTTIINTHTHGDHVSGNVEFPATVDIVVHENTATNMKTMKSPPTSKPAGANIFEVNQGRGLPKRTFKDRLSIGKGADQVDLYYFGRGHTDGDAWIVFPAVRVMHAGDIFSGKNLPLLDTNNGGSGLEIGPTLAKAHSGVKNVEVIITGHSTQMTMADLKEYADFNTEFAAFVRAGKKAGQSASQIAESWKLPDKYKGYAAMVDKDGKPIARILTNVEVIHAEIK